MLYTSHDIAQAEAAVKVAEQQLALAKSPYTSHDLAQVEAAVEAASAQLQLAKNPYTETDLKAGRAAVDQAKAAHELAKTQQRDAAVKAPITGLIAEKFVNAGAIVGPTVPIVSVVAGPHEITINVEESRLGLFKPGMAALVSVAAYPGETFEAVVKSIAPTVDTRSRTAAVRLTLKDPSGKLKPGMFAQVSLTSAERKGALLAPITTVSGRGENASVLLVKDGLISVQPVKVGLSDGRFVEITDGVSEGDQLVIGSHPELRGGERVTVSEAR